MPSSLSHGCVDDIVVDGAAPKAKSMNRSSCLRRLRC